MTPGNQIELNFFKSLEESIENKKFVKLVLSKKRTSCREIEIKKISTRIIKTKKGLRLSFNHHYEKKEIEKNFPLEAGLIKITELMETDFSEAYLFTTEKDIKLISKMDGDFSIHESGPTFDDIPSLFHDRDKGHLINLSNNEYLKELGVINAGYEIKPNMYSKFRQINKFIEIIDGLLDKKNTRGSLDIMDMGSGKGYLTFALYDYLNNQLKISSRITGVESRKELVNACNAIAQKIHFDELIFKLGQIENCEVPAIDMLIALHACDTATDEAIYKGIKAQAKIIICSPCCHKQIRKQFKATKESWSFLKHGIMKERQAEIITDGIRNLILEAFGYKTKIIEFIPLEHTSKNLMIIAVKASNNQNREDCLREIKTIKDFFGIPYHHLEKLLGLCI